MSIDLVPGESASIATSSNQKAIASAYIAEARKQYAALHSDLEIDDEPKVSITADGAWVASWVWVSQADISIKGESSAF